MSATRMVRAGALAEGDMIYLRAAGFDPEQPVRVIEVRSNGVGEVTFTVLDPNDGHRVHLGSHESVSWMVRQTDPASVIHASGTGFGMLWHVYDDGNMRGPFGTRPAATEVALAMLGQAEWPEWYDRLSDDRRIEHERLRAAADEAEAEAEFMRRHPGVL